MKANTTMLTAAALATCLLATNTWAADPVRGRNLYHNTSTTLGASVSECAGCHGLDPLANRLNIRAGANNPTAILNAINSGVGGMGVYRPYITATDAADLAAYIANPAAGTPSPAASLSTATLAFGSQVQGTSSATMSATLTNTGSASLVLATVTLGGTNPGDFTRSGTCVNALALAPAQSCTVSAVFRPTALGARSATVTIAHNATPASTTVTLTGEGVSAPTPAAALSATTVAFGNQTVGMTSAAKTVSITNTGTATLTVGSIGVGGANPGDFAAANCSNVQLNPGANCAISVTFTPAALNARSATLAIPTNAAGSPHGVALTGNGTSVPAPAVTLNPTTLAFGNQATGTTSATKTITLTNSGTASLAIASIAASTAEFGVSHGCPPSMAAGANCTISVTFAPTTVAPYAATLAVMSNAAGSPHSASLTGAGVAPTPTAPVATFSAASIDFGTLPLNTTSPARTLMLTNTGNAALQISALGVSGDTDFSQTGNCPVNGALAAGGSCSIRVTFAPTATGTRSATLVLTSNAAGAPSVALTGIGAVSASATAQVTPSLVAFRSTRIGKTSDDRTVRLRNSGSTPLVISSVATTGDFVYESECPQTLAPGKACEIEVRFKPTALGTRTGELTIGSNAAGSPHAVKLTGLAASGQKRADRCDDDDEDCGQSVLPFFRKSR